jgi:ribosomal protein L40E
MKCPGCNSDLPPDARFCPKCGLQLGLVCQHCNTPNNPGDGFCKSCGQPLTPTSSASERFGAPATYTPKHLAERILLSKEALEGERKQVTVLFADLKGSMELLADRDPEEARQLLDPVLEQMVFHPRPSAGYCSTRPRAASMHITFARTIRVRVSVCCTPTTITTRTTWLARNADDSSGALLQIPSGCAESKKK